MADEKDSILRLTKANAKAAAVTLGKAFQDYPVSVFFMPDDKKRRQQTPRVYRQIIGASINTGEVYGTSPKMEGVAIWVLHDSRQTPPKHRVSLTMLWLNLLADKGMKKRQKAFFDYSDSVRLRVVPERYWYLQMLGVDPAYQGKGYAGRLLRPMLARADKVGLPVFLETQLKKNVPLYEHFGFKVVEEGIIPGSNVYSWAMVRKNG